MKTTLSGGTTMNNKLKIILMGGIAVALLLCLFDMPYGYYTIVRFTATAAFAFFSFQAYEGGNKKGMLLFIALAVLFQPFIQLPLGRAIWICVDVLVAGYLFLLIIRMMKYK